MKIQTSPTGDIQIRHVSSFHWFFLIAILGLNIQVYSMNDAPLWLKITMTVILVIGLLNNSNFVIETHLSQSERKFRIRQLGILGVRHHDIGFDEILKFDLQVMYWGKYKKVPRYSLVIETFSDLRLIYSQAPRHPGKTLAAQLEELVFPLPASPMPKQLVLSSWIPSDFSSEAQEISLQHSSEQCPIVDFSSLDPSMVQTFNSVFQLPEGDEPLTFLDTTVFGGGGHGLVVARGGIYWHNSFICASRQCWLSWEEFVSTTIQKDPQDDDLWLAPGMQIELLNEAYQSVVYELLLTLQTRLKALVPTHQPKES